MKRIFRALGIAALLFSGPTAFGQSSPVSDWLRVYDPLGNIIQQVQATEFDEMNSGGAAIYSITVPGLVDLTTAPVPPTQVMDPDGSVSDIFGIANNQGGFYLSFASDSDTAPFPYSGFPNQVMETGLPMDATMYLAPALQAQGYKAAFWSDLDVVPDGGATAGLLGLALVGVFSLRRK